jgi:hypothetical protein
MKRRERRRLREYIEQQIKLCESHLVGIDPLSSDRQPYWRGRLQSLRDVQWAQGWHPGQR